LSLRGLSSSSKAEELATQNEQKEKRIRELEVERDLVRIDMRKLRDQVGTLKDEAEEAKLELMHAQKRFEDKLERARLQAVEEFKSSEEQKTLLGEYGSGSYHYGLRLARAFLRTKLPNDLKPLTEELRTVNELVDELELSASEAEADVEGDDDGEQADTPDAENAVDATDLD
jgi:chromosome segregation ATPase